MVRNERRGVPRLALTRAEAADALGVSVDFFDEHLAGELPCVRRGRRRLYPVAGVEGWLRERAESAVN
jgi:excisionase family DNA binding protein